MSLEEFKKNIQNIDIDYDYENTYYKLYNATVDYMNETQDWSFEYLFDDYITYDIAEEIAKQEMERGGLLRLYHFISGCDLQQEIFRIDGYGNLDDVDIDDLRYIKDEILEEIERKMEEN